VTVQVIPPQFGCASLLRQDQTLRVIDP